MTTPDLAGLCERLRAVICEGIGPEDDVPINPDGPEAAAEIERLTAEVEEARRRRDAWREKAEGYDEVRLALREKIGAPWPPNLSRALWAGIAADQKKRADDAEAEIERLREALTKIANSKITEDNPHWWRWAQNVLAEARAALSKASGEGV